MKKNTMMRIASVLLVAVLLSTCVISGTYAKYTSTATTTDSARVAHWGFNEAAVENIALFTYTDTGVAGAGGAKVIAPGTSNEVTLHMVYTDGASGTITAPEVAYELDVEVTLTGDYDDLEAIDGFSFTLNGAEKKLSEIETAIEAASGTYAAGALPTIFQETAKLGWAWEFEATGDDAVKAAANAADTALGNANPLNNVSITIEITATQLDA